MRWQGQKAIINKAMWDGESHNIMSYSLASSLQNSAV